MIQQVLSEHYSREPTSSPVQKVQLSQSRPEAPWKDAGVDGSPKGWSRWSVVAAQCESWLRKKQCTGCKHCFPQTSFFSQGASFLESVTNISLSQPCISPKPSGFLTCGSYLEMLPEVHSNILAILDISHCIVVGYKAQSSHIYTDIITFSIKK